jgi:Ras-related protein Rab-7A
MVYKITVGADFLTREIEKGQDKIHLQIWDTAGSEKYHSVAAGFYRNTELCVLCFDQTDIESFHHVESWRKELIQTLNPPEGDDFPFVLLGNKNDLKELIKVKQEDIDKYCQKHKNMPYFSVSAQLNINIEEAFDKVAEMALARNTKNEDFILPDVKPILIQKPKEDKKCC